MPATRTRTQNAPNVRDSATNPIGADALRWRLHQGARSYGAMTVVSVRTRARRAHLRCGDARVGRNDTRCASPAAKRVALMHGRNDIRPIEHTIRRIQNRLNETKQVIAGYTQESFNAGSQQCAHRMRATCSAASGASLHNRSTLTMIRQPLTSTPHITVNQRCLGLEWAQPSCEYDSAPKAQHKCGPTPIRDDHFVAHIPHCTLASVTLHFWRANNVLMLRENHRNVYAEKLSPE